MVSACKTRSVELTFSMVLLSHQPHQANFGRRNPIAAQDNNNLNINVGA